MMKELSGLLLFTFLAYVSQSTAFCPRGQYTCWRPPPPPPPPLPESQHSYVTIWKIVELFGGLYGKHIGERLEEYARLRNPDPVPVLEELKKISKVVDHVHPDIERNAPALIHQLIRNLLLTGEAEIAMNNVLKHIDAIDKRFQRFREIYVETRRLNFEHVDHFFHALLSPGPEGLQYDLGWMLSYVGGPGYESTKLFNLTSHQLQTTRYQLCNLHTSTQQQLLQLHNNIVLREMKGYLMLVTAHIHQGIRRRVPFAREVYRASTDFQVRLTEYVYRIQLALAVLPTEIRRCGKKPLHPIELKGPFKGLVVDDKENNGRCDADKQCPKTMSLSPILSKYGNTCEKLLSNSCLGSSCYDKMTDCESLEYHEITVCRADPTNSTRNFQYIDVPLPKGSHTFYGHKTVKCPGRQFDAIGKIWIGEKEINCAWCMCTCTQSGWQESNIRTISFVEEKAATTDGRAVIGVRFVEKNGIVHLQIKEGKVLQGGKILKGSERWKPVENLQRKFTSQDPRVSPEIYVTNKGKETKLEEHVHYGHISDDFKTISLANVTVPKNYLVTGVKLQYEGNSVRTEDIKRGDPIEIQITATPFDFESGKFKFGGGSAELKLTSSKQTNESPKREEIVFDHPDAPTEAPKNEVYPGSSQIVNFRVTDYKKDGGQTIIPLFDTEEVETKPSSPLGGVGLHFKGSPGYGGFIALNAFTLDLYDYYNPNLTLPELPGCNGRTHGCH